MLPELNVNDLDHWLFQHYGATCHIIDLSLDLFTSFPVVGKRTCTTDYIPLIRVPRNDPIISYCSGAYSYANFSKFILSHLFT